MAKKKLGGSTLGGSRAESLLADIQEREEMKIDDVAIVSKAKMQAESEIRNKRVQAVIKPSEYEIFIDSIGRMSESDAIRELILLATNQPTNKPREREQIIKLIDKSKQL